MTLTLSRLDRPFQRTIYTAHIGEQNTYDSLSDLLTQPDTWYVHIIQTKRISLDKVDTYISKL